MTMQDIKASALDGRKRLIALSREELGMGNYKSIMRRYQQLMLLVFDLFIEMADADTNTPTVQVLVGDQAKKDEK